MEKNLEQYLRYLRLEKKYSEHTILAYNNDILVFLTFLQQSGFGSWNIEYAAVRAWIVQLSEAKISNRSINRKISALQSFYLFLLRVGDVDKNPLAVHRSLKVEKKLQLPFSVDEIERVRDLIKQEKGFVAIRDLLIIELLYTLGLRRSELCNIQLRDVDFSNAVIKVIGKGNKARFIPVFSSVVELLFRYIKERAVFCTDKKKVDFLLVDNKGAKVSEMFVYRLINLYFSNVTTKDKKSPHMLRHSFATHLLEGGADMNSIKELMGHESLSSTEIYAQVNLKELKKMYLQSHPRIKTKK